MTTTIYPLGDIRIRLSDHAALQFAKSVHRMKQFQLDNPCIPLVRGLPFLPHGNRSLTREEYKRRSSFARLSFRLTQIWLTLHHRQQEMVPAGVASMFNRTPQSRFH